jgi:hypothetical protein
MNNRLWALVFSVLFICLADLAIAQEDLAKASQNPVGDIVSLPFEYWHYDGLAGDSAVDVIVAKPVYPINLGAINLINRLIVPYLWVDVEVDNPDIGEIPSPQTEYSEHGLGNIQYQGFLTSAAPGKVIWGLGPVLEMPTNTNDLGSDKWSAGPAAVVLTMPGNWVLGMLAQNIWSFAGSSDEADVHKFTFQYFINYNLAAGWYLTSTPIITANWKKPSDKRWTVPFGGGIGKLTRFGKQPVDFKLQGFGNVKKPDGGPEWSLQFAVKFLFPK